MTSWQPWGAVPAPAYWPSEQQVITNVFELDTRMVSSAMSPRDRVAFFLRDEPDSVIRLRIAAEPSRPTRSASATSTMWWATWMPGIPFQRVLNNQPISLRDDTFACARR